MKTLSEISFGLPVTTTYSNGKITATLLHGNETKTRKRVSYNHSLNQGDNHYAACLAVLEKVKAEEGKDFEVVAYTYSEKGTGYTFTCHRAN